MATTKRATKVKAKSKPAAAAKKKKPGKPGRPRGAVTAPKPPRPAPAGPISPLTGLPTREKIHLPIKGYGRLNGFQVLENLFGKTIPQLKQILAYEEKHQA